MTQTLKHPLAIAQLCKSWQIKVFNQIESEPKNNLLLLFLDSLSD